METHRCLIGRLIIGVVWLLTEASWLYLLTLISQNWAWPHLVTPRNRHGAHFHSLLPASWYPLFISHSFQVFWFCCSNLAKKKLILPATDKGGTCKLMQQSWLPPYSVNNHTCISKWLTYPRVWSVLVVWINVLFCYLCCCSLLQNHKHVNLMLWT